MPANTVAPYDALVRLGVLEEDAHEAAALLESVATRLGGLILELAGAADRQGLSAEASERFMTELGRDVERRREQREPSGDA